MRRFGWFCSAAMLVSCFSARAQEKGSWHAVSSTARSITGDVALADEKISIDYVTFAIARIRGLAPGEIGAAFDADTNAGRNGSLYRLTVPAGTRFLHKNTLCGDEDTRWMVAYAAGKSLQLAFFSGQTPPVLTPEAIGSSTDLCGTFTYAR